MHQTLRNILATVAGILVFFVGVTGLHLLTGPLMGLPPTPQGMPSENPEAWAAFISGLSTVQMLSAMFSHIGGTFLGALTAAWIAKDGRLVGPMTVAAVALVGGVMNAIDLTGQPVWFTIIDLSLYLPAGYLACQLAKKKRAEPVAPPA